MIASKTDLTLVRDGKKISCLSVPYVPLSVCFQPNKPLVAIGGQVNQPIIKLIITHVF